VKPNFRFRQRTERFGIPKMKHEKIERYHIKRPIVLTEDLAFLLLGLLDPFEISTFCGCVVSDVGLLLLVYLTSVYNLFNSTCRHQPENFDIPKLTYTICSILSLEVITWVPVGIEDNNFVRARNVQTDAY